MNARDKHPILKRASGLLDAFRQDRRGAILPFLAIVIVVIIVAAGAGLDFGRAINQRQAVARGLDAAMLAVARELSVRNMSSAEIKAYLDSNYEAYFGANAAGSGIKDATIVIDDPKIDTETRKIEVSASSQIPTYFIHLAGIGPDVLNVSVNAQAVYPKSVEAVLVLDVTGSMGGSKIKALREAATTFVNTLIPPDAVASNEKVKIAVVPYASGVNIGTTRATLATKGANLSRTSYTGCVTERDGAQAYTDAGYITASVGPGPQQASNKKGYYRNSSGDISDSAGYVCPSVELVPLTLDPGSATKSGTPLHTIANLPASGNTAGQTGVAWGWYTLSSSWSALWPASSKPAPYTDERVLKYMLLMTDGEFNTWFDGPTKVKGKTYDWIAEQSSSESTNRAIKLCAAAKSSGIKIITVGFQIGSLANAKKVMSQCASSPADYYLADNDEELKTRFSAIANQIKTTYLSR
ncbi:pilus assembly protein TadG-related protein [Stappia sp.]|uniref:pilus assembly protein TadG-related protein n=1 Tax=Stappia sp. TaxID=1870903 RepID=UPI003A98E129